MKFYDNFLNNISTSPDDKYRELHQETINHLFYDTTQHRIIKEQKVIKKDNKFFADYRDKKNFANKEVWLSNVADDLINPNKSYGDFIDIMFKDMSEMHNYKGQYYLIDLDDKGTHFEYYICYDTIMPLELPNKCKCVRCNNILKWVDDKTGEIVEFPCYLGNEISSTNNFVTKKAIVPNMRIIVFVQANEYTKRIVKNQRFMFEHTTAFAVEEIDNFSKERYADGEVTYVKLYLDYSPIVPNDNVELNLCSYYEPKYKLDINQGDITNIVNFTDTLTASFYIDDVLQEDFDNFAWKTSDKNVVTIDEYGNIKIVGDVGEQATITCSLINNANVFDTIKVTVMEDVSSDNKILSVSPIITELCEDESIDFVCNIYNNGNLVHNVNYLINSNQELSNNDINCLCVGDVNSFEITQTENGYNLTNIMRSKTPLILKFSANNCEDVTMNIKMKGLI